MSFKYISQLKPPGQNQIVKIRVTRIWDCCVPTSNRFLGIAFLATDSQGDAIHVQIRDFDCPKFQGKLIEGSVYKIAKFQVVRPNIRYLSTTREFAILFSSITQLTLISDDPTPYPRYHFEFLDREKMSPHVNSDKYLIDAIGTLISIGPILNVQLTKYEKIVEKRDVMLKEASGDELKITVWESTFPQLNADKLLQIRPNPVLLFVGTMIKTFQGIIYLASTSATKIYINLDIPETKAIQQQQKLGEQPVQLLALSSQIPNMLQRIQEAKYATIAQLLQFSPATIGNALFTCDARVEQIDTSNGWFFYSCNICKKVMTETENGDLTCYDHGQGIPKLTLRLRMIIQDETADMEITTFDKQAELMTNLNMDFLQAMEEVSQTIVPEKITAIVKRKFVFTVGLPPKAIKDDILTYRIYRTKPIQLEGQTSTQTREVQLAFSQSPMEDKSDNSETNPQNDTNDTLKSFIQVGLPRDLAVVESPAKKQRRGKEKIE